MRYAITKYSKEINFKNRFEIMPGCTTDQDDLNFEVVKEFDSYEEARNFFVSLKSEIEKMTYNGTIFIVTEYALQPMEFDEYEEEFLPTGNIDAFSEMHIIVTNKTNYEERIFNNYKDAENYSAELDDFFISF